MEVLLSFIVPNLNSGDLLQETVNSIICKYFHYEYEIIVVDGLSNDQSIDFIKNSYVKNIYLLEQKDINVYDAMNKGVKASNGKWLMFLGAGDMITESVSTLKLNSLTDYLIIYGSVYWKSKEINYDGAFDLKKLFYKNICQQGIIYNRFCFKRYSFFNINYFINADHRFNLKIFIHNIYRIKYIDTIFCTYRGDGISHVNSDNFNKIKYAYILYHLLISKYLNNKKLFIHYLKFLVFKKIKFITNVRLN
jgi:hypothetical protein